jgi:poly-gamma-glutamate system protein
VNVRRVIYSHHKGYRSVAFVMVGLISVVAYAGVLRFPNHASTPAWVLSARRHAVEADRRGQAVIRNQRLRLGLAVNAVDRLGTGLVGASESPVTTGLGSAPAKRTSAEPLFAAAIVDMLYRAGVRPGGAVAVGQTGSFPAFNLATEVAVEAMGAHPLIISSVGSSQWGANQMELTWPDMERALVHAGVVHTRSLAVSPGGTTAVGVAPDAETLARRRVATASGADRILILPLHDEIAFRDVLYRSAAASLGRPIQAFVNIGGGAADIGVGESVLPSGLSRPRYTAFEAARLGVVGRMGHRGVPIVNMLDVRHLAGLYDLQYDPAAFRRAADLPGPLPDPWVAALAAVLLLAVVIGAHRLGFFRVPDWEMPAALRSRGRVPLDTGEPNVLDVGAGVARRSSDWVAANLEPAGTRLARRSRKQQ